MKYITPQLMKRTTTDIIALPANSDGDDYILGDLHGNIDILNQVSAKLDASDRLFLLGDLVDRGNDSARLLLSIIDRDPRSVKIFAITGNHEILTINAIHGLLYILNSSQTDHLALLEKLKFRIIACLEPEKLTNVDAKAALLTIYRKENPLIKKTTYFQAIADIFTHYKNGGEWLLNLFLEEIANESLMNDKSRIKKILNYLLNLPYIIHVEGGLDTPPFHLVHADMPFDDKTLSKRLQTDSSLTLDEKKYAAWARCRTENPKSRKIYMRDNGRDGTSIVAYAGHNIVNNETKLAVRNETNTVNLDVGIYYEDVGILYCATDNDYLLISPVDIQNELADHELLKKLDHTQARKFRRIIQTLEDKYQVHTHLNDMYRRLQMRESKHVDAIIFDAAVKMSMPDAPQEQLEYTFTRLYEYAYKNGAIEKENYTDDSSDILEAFDGVNAVASNLMALSMFANQNEPALIEIDLTNRTANLL